MTASVHSARRRRTALAAATALCAAWTLLLGGCGYSVGEGDQAASSDGTAREAAPARFKESYQLPNGYVMGPVHPTHIKTVHVEIFNSQTFYRNLEFRLTEALQKRIMQDTPYRLASKASADTVIYGEITRVRVSLLGSDFDSDLPRENQPTLVCNWVWKNRRTGEIIAQRVGMEQSSEFLPLAGETFFDGTAEGIDDLSERIVEAMHSQW